jgi:serine transporter
MHKSKDITMKINKSNIQENAYWIFTLFGTAVGAGILFLPIQAGMGGLWVLITASFLVYPMVYPSQRLYARIVNNTPEPIDYTGAVKLFLGKKTGMVINILFVIFLFVLLIAYSIGLTNDIGDFFHENGITKHNLAQSPYLSLILLVLFFAILKYSKNALIKILGVLSVVLILLLFTLSLMLIGMWDFERLIVFPSFTEFIKQLFMIFPLLIMSFMFFSVISPMVMSLRNKDASTSEVGKRYSRILKVTVVLLMTFILFFVFSCVFALDVEELKKADAENVSVLELLGDTVSNSFLRYFGPAISIIALTTSFFGVALGLRSSGLELISGFFKTKQAVKTRFKSEVIFYSVAIVSLWLITLSDINIINLFGELIAPLNSLFLYFVPVIIVFKQPIFKQYRTTGSVLIFVSGVVLVISYFIGKMI